MAPSPIAAPQASTKVYPAAAATQGTWSYEVERMARAQGCTHQDNGALVVSKDDTSEHYQVSCENGRNFSAVCDKLSCRQG